MSTQISLFWSYTGIEKIVYSATEGKHNTPGYCFINNSGAINPLCAELLSASFRKHEIFFHFYETPTLNTCIKHPSSWTHSSFKVKTMAADDLGMWETRASAAWHGTDLVLLKSSSTRPSISTILMTWHVVCSVLDQFHTQVHIYSKKH